jgi:hypothetical protein
MIQKNFGDETQFSAKTPNASGSITVTADTNTSSATGDMNSNKFKESSFSVSLVNSKPWSTDFSALANVALKHAMNPVR